MRVVVFSCPRLPSVFAAIPPDGTDQEVHEWVGAGHTEEHLGAVGTVDDAH